LARGSARVATLYTKRFNKPNKSVGGCVGNARRRTKRRRVRAAPVAACSGGLQWRDVRAREGSLRCIPCPTPLAIARHSLTCAGRARPPISSPDTHLSHTTHSKSSETPNISTMQGRTEQGQGHNDGMAATRPPTVWRNKNTSRPSRPGQFTLHAAPPSHAHDRSSLAAVLGLAKVPRHVAVLDHVSVTDKMGQCFEFDGVTRSMENAFWRWMAQDGPTRPSGENRWMARRGWGSPFANATSRRHHDTSSLELRTADRVDLPREH